jgi:hypothetical protein
MPQCHESLSNANVGNWKSGSNVKQVGPRAKLIRLIRTCFKCSASLHAVPRHTMEYASQVYVLSSVKYSRRR